MTYSEPELLPDDETEFGPLNCRAGDYPYIPKATVCRIVPSALDNVTLVIESVEELRVPIRQQ